jgi:glycosyltransferase involved in cell wall biosynthesis
MSHGTARKDFRDVSISVIIATFNRAALLSECLAHLTEQQFEPGDEVIVVDNGSTDHTPEAIDGLAVSFSVPLRHLREAKPGKTQALARAIQAATGDVLAFTDDDVNVGAAWVATIRSLMREPSIALVGGPVVARCERRAPDWLRAAILGSGRLAAPLGLLDYGGRRLDLGPRTVLGANLVIRRDVLNSVGGFAPHMGKLRGTLLMGEDHDLCQRVQATGRRAVYDPALPVSHWVPARRMRLRYYLSWFFWSGITQACLEGEPGEGSRSERPQTRRQVLGVPLYLYKRAALCGVRAVVWTLSGRRRQAIESAIDVAFAAGYARARWQPPDLFTVSGGRA